MNTPAPLPASPELETTLAAVETQLASLGESLRANDSVAIDHHATELHRALASHMLPAAARCPRPCASA
jgi:hypothetical protein